MSKASSGALSTFVTTPEGEERVRAYKEAQEALREALDARENQLFDPTLLAISQALGSPTKTGSFGEVLGNVAGAIGTSQQAEEKRAREVASMRFELAQQGLQSYQATAGDKAFRDALSRRGPQAAGQPSPAGQPATAGQPAEPGGASTQPASGAPQGLRAITTDDIALVAGSPNGVPKAEFLMKLQDSERGRFKTLDLDEVVGQRRLALV